MTPNQKKSYHEVEGPPKRRTTRAQGGLHVVHRRNRGVVLTTPLYPARAIAAAPAPPMIIAHSPSCPPAVRAIAPRARQRQLPDDVWPLPALASALLPLPLLAAGCIHTAHRIVCRSKTSSTPTHSTAPLARGLQLGTFFQKSAATELVTEGVSGREHLAGACPK
jgi:hypothetical protein